MQVQGPTGVLRFLKTFASLTPWCAGVVLALCTALGAAVKPVSASTTEAQAMTLYVTDRGIDQMAHWLEGREGGLTWSMSQLAPEDRIVVVMPRGKDFSSVSPQDLRKSIYSDLMARIGTARRAGHKAVEIQLVEDLSPLTYFNDGRQSDADKFGAAAYGAIADVNASLARQNVKVTNRANLGSNGTKVFAANVEAWAPAGRALWESVDMFDGRAFLPQMVKAIDRIGAARVRLFNTTWDWWAPHTPWAMSIGNAATARQLKDDFFPLLKVYKLSSLDKQVGHISGMSDSLHFYIDEYLGRKDGLKPLPRPVSGADLRRPTVLPKAVDRAAISPALAEGVSVWRSTAQDMVGALKTFADDFGTEHGAQVPLARHLRGLARGTALTQALLEDIEQSGDRPTVVLTSRTLEALVTFAMDDVAASSLTRNRALQPLTKDLAAYKALYSGLLEAARTGKVGTDTMQSFDRAVLELAKREMTERHAADLGRQFKVAPLERSLALTERNLQKVSQAAASGSGNRDLDRARNHELRVVTQRAEEQRAELETARASVKAEEARFARRLMLLDALPEFAGAMAEHARQGRVTIDVVDRYSDAVITLSASYLAGQLAAVPMLAPYAPTLRDAIVATSRYTRDHLAREPIQSYYNFLAGGKWQVLEQYQAYQSQATARSQTLKTFTEMYGADELSKLGFSSKEIASQDEQALRLNGVRSHPRGAPDLAALQPPRSVAKDPVAERRRNDELPAVQQGLALAPPPPPPPPPPQPAPRPPPCAAGIGSCGGIDLGLTALVVDPGTRTIVALAEGGSPTVEAVAPDLMALALYLEGTSQQAAFSLDPYDPKDPAGKWLRALYFPDALRGTAIGNQCFEADFLLKQMSFGVRVEGDQVVERLSASGLKSIPERMAGQHGPTSEQWSRLWIVTRAVRLVSADGIVRVELAKMGVEARRQVPDPTTRSGLRDVATPGDSIEKAFAHQYEELYEQLSTSEAPSLASVRTLVKAIALARWLKTNGMRVDMEAVIKQLNRGRVPAVDKVSALSVDWSSQSQAPFSDRTSSGVRTTTRKLHVFGGVDLAVNPKYIKNAREVPLRDAVVSGLKQAQGATKFELDHAGRHYRAYVMPFKIVDNRTQ